MIKGHNSNVNFYDEGENEWDPREGWYFSDETEGLNGPYETEIECEKALKDYVETQL